MFVLQLVLLKAYWKIKAFMYSKQYSKFSCYILLIAVLCCVVVSSCSDSKVQEQHLIELQPPQAQQSAHRDSTMMADSMSFDTAAVTHIAIMKTSVGNITIGLFGKNAPVTVGNFTELCKRKYYDGILFHRVAKGFVLQAGDPLTRDTAKKAQWGNGGDTYNGKPLPDEVDTTSVAMMEGYKLGTVAMATELKPNTGSSQFFICLDKATHLRPVFSIFGKVLDGMNTIRTIEKGEPDENDGTGQTPKHPVKIVTIEVKEVK